MQQQHQPPPPPQQQQQSGSSVGAAAALNGTTTTLSFDEVAKHFTVPIAEAATTLGVCTSVLKRICRDNGIVRWPYRKFLAGKTVEDIKKDAAREKGKELAELSKVARERMDFSAITHPTSVVSSPTLGTEQHQNRTPVGQAQEKLQRGVSATGHVTLQQQGNKPVRDERRNTLHSLNPRSIPNYCDEFKYGFPVNGLSSASTRWWGGRDHEGTEMASQEETAAEEDESSIESSRCMMIDGEPDEEREDAGTLRHQPASSLCSLRKRAVMDGYELLKLDVTRGYGLKLQQQQQEQ